MTLRALGIHTPQDYGAVADGETSDQAAFDAATAVIRREGGGALHIPPGFYVLDQLRMCRNMTVTGAGRATRIRQSSQAPDHLVVLDDPDVQWTSLSGLWLDGHREAQTSPNDCVHYDNDGGRFTFGDPVHHISDLMLYTPKGDGLHLSAECRETRVSNVYVTGADGYGFNIRANDSVFSNATSGGSGLDGWYCAGNNSRYSNCKSFGSGRLNPDSDGFRVAQNAQMFSGCEAQDNSRHGYLVYETHGICFAACVADSNGVGGGGQPGGVGWRIDHAEHVALQGVAFNRDGRRDQAYGLELADAPGVQASLVAHDNALGDVKGVTAGHYVIVNGRARR